MRFAAAPESYLKFKENNESTMHRALLASRCPWRALSRWRGHGSHNGAEGHALTDTEDSRH